MPLTLWLVPFYVLSNDIFTNRMVQFLYFLVAAGCTLIIMGFLSLIMDTHHRWGFGTIVRFFSHLVVGIAVALLAIMVNYEAGFNFAVSPWILPTYTLAVALGQFIDSKLPRKRANVSQS